MDESKLAPKLLAKLQEVSPQELEAAPSIPVIIRYRPDVVRTHTVAEDVEATFVYELTPTVAASASGLQIGELTEDTRIEYVWLDEEIHTCLDRSPAQIDVPAVWSAGYQGTGIRVAIVDTGLDTQHPDFAGRVAAGASFVGGDSVDDNGHGTHVAGIAAGDGSASGGMYRGIAPEAVLYVAKVLDRDGSGSMSSVMAGVEWAVGQNVQIINLSLGGSGSSDGQDALSLTCNAAVARGTVVCAAAGNAGPGSRTIGSPGAAADVVTIGAVDRNDGIARFSSRGPTADGRTKPDVCLPGTDIRSARASGTTMGTPVNDRYTAASGTSMATPHASGVAALLLQAKPSLNPSDIKRLLMDTALDLGQDANAQGAGRAQAYHALQAALGQPIPTPEPPGEEPTPPEKPDGCLPTFLIPLVGR
nr:peptidase S8 family protein [uncultured bacterium]